MVREEQPLMEAGAVMVTFGAVGAAAVRTMTVCSDTAAQVPHQV
jgi:hypothetical protein